MARYFIKKSAVVDELDISCPYCGEIINVLVDYSPGNQDYYEDCSVCCCPILFESVDDGLGDFKLIAKRDDE